MRRTFACSLLMVGFAAGAARAQQAPQVDAHFASASIRPGDAAQLEVIALIGADAPDDAVVTADPISIGRSTFVLKITKTSYLFSGACPANRQCFEADINTDARLTPGARQVPITVTDSKGRTTSATATVQIAGAPRDTDNDGLPDAWENEYGLLFFSSEGVDGGSGDPDGDGVSNLDEFRANTNPVERHVRLFAEGSSGAAQPLQSCVTFLPMNPDQPISHPPVHVVFVGDNGRIAYQSFPASDTPRTICPLALAVADRVVEIRVESEIELAVERDTSSGPSPANTRYPQLTNTSLGVQDASRTWIFADGHTGDGIDEFLLLYNPSSAPVTATLTYVRAPSTVVAQASRVLPPGIRTTIWLNQDQPEALGGDVSVTIAADAGILAERAFRYHAPGRTVPHDSVSRGAWTTATHWYFPDVDSRGPFASSIVLMNPTTKSTKVTLTSQFPDRAPARLDIALTGGERRELTLRDLPVPAGTTFGIIVDASDGVGIVAERTASGATSSGGWRRSTLGAMQPGTSWILPTTGSLALDATDLVLLNVSDTPAHVRIRMRYTDYECCETSEATVDVPARGSLHVPMGTNDPARTIPTFSGASLIVDSIPNASGATASIVVERTNYSDIDGVTRSRTNSIIANQVR